MILKVLVDNNTYIDQYHYGEPAVSYYIEDDGVRLLFDVGYSDLFLKNAKSLGIDLENIDSLVISHGHDDHTGGLKHYFDGDGRKEISVIAHSDAFKEKIIDGMRICSPILEEDLKEKCKLILSKEPFEISKNIIFLGEIPSSNDFEKRAAIGTMIEGKGESDDYVMDDTAIAYRTENGIYIITGCSHSGICNIVEHAKKVCGDDRVLGIIGGFHLFEVNGQVKRTIEYFNKNKIGELYPCHCVSFDVKAEIHKEIPVKEVGVGLEIEW